MLKESFKPFIGLIKKSRIIITATISLLFRPIIKITPRITIIIFSFLRLYGLFFI